MIDITQGQIGQRWDSLPNEIREVVFSDTAADFIDRTCQEEHLPEEKIGDVSRVTGFVLYGFIHPEDMPKELADELQIDLRIAIAITQKINDRIFAPLRPLIDKTYSPMLPLTLSIANPIAPQVIQDINPAKADAPKIISTGAVPATPVPLPKMPIPAVPSAPKLNLSATGWSKLPSAAFVPKPAVTPPTTAAPKAPVFAPKPASEPAPVIIHEDAIFKAQPAKPDFHIAIHPEDLEIKKTANVVPLKPAVLELGKVSTPTPAKVVHYDEFKEKLFANIPAPGAKGVPQRNITEITAMPKPPAPPAPVPSVPTPAPAPAPKPSIAPTKMAEEIKVVQKDYL